MLFSEVLGQSEHKSFLKSLVIEDRLPHALLLLGPEGCGHLPLAIALSQYIQCSGNKADEACGQCSDCLKAAKYIHPDIHFSYPFIGAQNSSTTFLKEWRTAITTQPNMNAFQWLASIGAENKQGNINKLECFQIIQKLGLQSFEGEKKILLMWMPEYLAKEGNRLLKLIEEPPANTVIILVAESEDRILNTILSRCQLVKINPYSEEEITSFLTKNIKVPPTRAKQIAYMSEGNLINAIKLGEELEDENIKMVLEFLRVSYTGKAVDISTWVDEFSKVGREKQKVIINGGIHFLSQLLRLKLIPESAIKLQEGDKIAATKMTKLLEFDQIELIVELMNETILNIQRNAHPKILMMNLALKVHDIMRKKHLVNT